jgi:hypothetical protein
LLPSKAWVNGKTRKPQKPDQTLQKPDSTKNKKAADFRYLQKTTAS